MAKSIPDAFIDLMLGLVEGDVVNVCSAEPTTYTEAITTFKLAFQAIDGADYTLADGDVSGRKNTLLPDIDLLIDSSGTATHIAVTNLGDTSLRLVTTCTSQALTAGGDVTIPAFAHEILDAA